MSRYRKTVLKVLVCAAVAGFAVVTTPSAATRPEGRIEQETVHGTLTVLYEDEFVDGGQRLIYLVSDRETGRHLRLLPSRPFDPALRTGAPVAVRGIVRGEQIHEAVVSAGPPVAESASVASPQPRSIAVLLVDFADSAVGCSDAQVADKMFSGAQSVDGLYQEASFGKLAFPGDSNTDGQPDVFRVTIDASVNEGCDAFGWSSEADEAAASAGHQLDTYLHRLYVLPSNVSCSWAGLATLGCFGPCRAWVSTCSLQDVYAHELGHNLGFGHASTDSDNNGSVDCEYCDKSDFMGIGGVGWRQVNGPHKRQLGWLSSEQMMVFPGGVDTVVVEALETAPSEASFPQLVSVPSSEEGNPYYLSFRQPVGYDATLQSQYVGRTAVHRHAGGPSNSLLVEQLDDGEQFVDAGAGVTITQLSRDGSTVTLLVESGCGVESPFLSIDADYRQGQPGETLNWLVTVTNTDSGPCGADTFTLSAELPEGWTGEFSPTSQTLGAGEQGSSTLSVTAASAAAEGAQVIALQAQGLAAGHDATASVTFEVQDATPDAPDGLEVVHVRGRARLSWDVVAGASAYRVHRDGTVLGEVTGTTWSDAAPSPEGASTYHLTAVAANGQESGAGDAVEAFNVSGRRVKATPDRPPPD